MAERGSPNAKSPHAFMREALGVQSRLLEQRQAFVAAALRSEREALDSSQGYRAADVARYFELRAAQSLAQRPALRRWRK